MAGRAAFALLYEMRCGKSAPLLVDFYRSDADDLLIIAPAGCYRTWLTAVSETPPPIGTEVYLWSADDRDAVRLYNFESWRGRRILIIDVEALSNVERARALCLRFLTSTKTARRSMVALDEAVSIKNPDAKRSQFVVDEIAPLATYRRILTGLPTPRGPLDIYQQFAFLDKRIIGAPDYDSFFKFHAVTQVVPNQAAGRYVRVVVGYREVQRIHDRIAPHSHRVLRSDCYDVPPKTYERWEVKMTSEQRRIYDSLRETASAELAKEKYVTAGMVVTQMLRLHQVLLGHGVDDDGTVHEVPTNRIAELIKILDGVSGKAVIWCSYDHSVRAITSALRKEFGERSVARFWGGNVKTRELEECQFKEDPKCRFEVATPAAGRFSREWSIADTVVYFSSTPDLDHRMQSEDRVQAIGKTRPVSYIDMLVPGTVEERFVRALVDKKKLSDLITGDKYKEWLGGGGGGKNERLAR